MLTLPATLLTTLTFLTLTHAQSSGGDPTAVVPSTYLPIIIPTGTSLAASVITAATDGNQVIMAVQCKDDACKNDPPATASFSLDVKAGTGSYTFAWTARDNTLNSTSYGCSLTTDVQKNVPCTVAFPSGLTATADQYSNYPMATLVAPFPSGAAQMVGITSGAQMLPASSLICGMSTCNANQVSNQSGSAPTSGSSSSGSMGSSSATPTGGSSSGSSQGVATASGPASASGTAQPSSGAAGVFASAGMAMAAVALVGAVAL